MPEIAHTPGVVHEIVIDSGFQLAKNPENFDRELNEFEQKPIKISSTPVVNKKN